MPGNHILAHNSSPIKDRDKILGSTPMFMLMGNLLMTLVKSYTYWFTHNSKWLPLDKWTSQTCSSAHSFFQEHNENYLASFLRSPSTWKKDATITKLGWTTCVTSFYKWMSENPILPHNSAPIRDRIEILGSTPMFMLMSKLSMTLMKSYAYWLTHNSEWLPLHSGYHIFAPMHTLLSGT